MNRLPWSWSARTEHWVQLAAALLLALVVLFNGLTPVSAQSAGVSRPHLLVDERAAIDVWPAVTLRTDAGPLLDVQAVQAQADRFHPPTGTTANLGRTADTVWLRVPLQVPGAAAVNRVLDIDYPSLNRIDVFLVQGAEHTVLSRHRLGNELHFDERPMPSRSHAVELALPPGASELFIRVQTRSSMVLPITLRTPKDFATHASRMLLVQGVLAGLALCMLVYSLVHGASLRDPVFGLYALMLIGNAVFFLSYFGVGAMVLWPHSPQLSQQIGPMAVLVAVFGGAGFMHSTLEVQDVSRWASRILRGCSLVALAGLCAGLAGAMSYGAIQTLATALGPIATGVVLPVVLVRAARGERIARYMAVGWACYVLGALAIAGLLRGLLEPTFWVQNLYPLAAMLEMAVWMAVLGMRVQAVHRQADRARVETETLRALAHTDALTGLPNRRGLQERITGELQQCGPGRVLAVYLLDLDGFKPVNDQYGHDVGDALLVAVGQRLKAQLRQTDVVARLGGDEFVVLAANLADENTARNVGQKMLAAFQEPFEAAGQRCSVGLTIGYALAPFDAADADGLLKRADAAMYAGKQNGRQQVVRGGRKADVVVA